MFQSKNDGLAFVSLPLLFLTKKPALIGEPVANPSGTDPYY